MAVPYYPPANRDVQDFVLKFAGSMMDPNVVVLHTTESGSWPTYEGGATAPHFTALPDKDRRRLVWRQHFPVTMSSRALRNLVGGVETNTLNAIQVELIGSCDRRDGFGAIYWPDAPEWALRELAKFLVWTHQEWNVRLDAPALWLPYPESYGDSRARFTFAQWRNFYGVCGHQHVPENVHGDPGDLDIDTVLSIARDVTRDPKPVVPTDPPEPVVEPTQPNRVQRARLLIRRAIAKSDRGSKRRRTLADWLRSGPRR